MDGIIDQRTALKVNERNTLESYKKLREIIRSRERRLRFVGLTHKLSDLEKGFFEVGEELGENPRLRYGPFRTRLFVGDIAFQVVHRTAIYPCATCI